MTETPTLEHDWCRAALPPNVEIGEGSWLYSSFAFLHCRSRRPVGVRIGAHTGVYIDTLFDLGVDGEVVIGDYCTLAGPIFCTEGRIAIGDGVLISSRVVVADTPFAAPPPAKSPRRREPPTVVEVGDDAWIGTGAVLLAGARIGRGAIIGAASVVDDVVPDNAVVAGDPAKIVGWTR